MNVTMPASDLPIENPYQICGVQGVEGPKAGAEKACARSCEGPAVVAEGA